MITLKDKEYEFQVGTFLHEMFVEELTGDSITVLYEAMTKTPARAIVALLFTGLQAGHEATGQPLEVTEKELRLIVNDMDLPKLIKQLTPTKKKE